MFVVIGNPPYNAGQVNENDNNKNRVYPTMDALIRETYAKDSTASNKNSLYDPYVKSLRWASDRIGKEGIVALVTNNSFLDGRAFDGMRKHLAADFDEIYILDLGGNARKDKLVADASVFGIRVGVSINLFVKRAARDRPSRYGEQREPARIFYYRTDDAWNKHQKFEFLAQTEHVGNVPWQILEPDERHTWLTEGLQEDFDTFLPIGHRTARKSKGEATGVIFHQYGIGLQTARDAWLYHFNRTTLTENVKATIETYNTEMLRWQNTPEASRAHVDDFVVDDNTQIKWSSG